MQEQAKEISNHHSHEELELADGISNHHSHKELDLADGFEPKNTIFVCLKLSINQSR